VQHRAALSIPADHPAYAGHFPGQPILPGVVLLDEAVTAITVCGVYAPQRWQISAAKFQMMVRPGDALHIEHEPAGNGAVKFAIRRGADMIASGLLSPP
jgi:3-hydroxymyristoyl/3-hydroxydecanoyl-(acyl carrier protein) dehydratase